jgi:flagellar basal body P-ring formation protein FlgA
VNRLEKASQFDPLNLPYRSYSASMEMDRHPSSYSAPGCARLLAAWLLSLFCGLCGAQQLAGTDPAGIEQQVRQLALDGLHQSSRTDIRRVEVQVGQLDPRLRLAPCSQVQPYVPTGSVLWGRTRIGLRCVQGEKPWNVFLPITVKVMAPALVAASTLPAGHVLTEADLTQAEVDLAENTSQAIVDTDLATGRSLTRAMAPGQSLRQFHLKPRQWFAAGDWVKVVAIGPGYRVASQGEAQTAGLEGQVARIKMESGRTLTGMPVADRLVELPL